MCTVKLFLLYETVKYVSLLHPCWYLSNHKLLRQELFELKHITCYPKVYMNINKVDSDRIFYDGGDDDSNELTQDPKTVCSYRY